MKSYYRVLLGPKSKHAEECLSGGFIGIDFGIDQDLTGKLPEEWRDFNKEFIPVYLEAHPGKTRIAAGLACGAVHTLCRGIQNGDIVLCPDKAGRFHLGEIVGDYIYEPGSDLPHRRPVRWLNQAIDRSDMSEALAKSAESFAAVANYNQHATEIERRIGGIVIPREEAVEDPYVFVLEQHLEDFLVKNWALTELGGDYEIYQQEDGQKGQQFPTDTGYIDILAISKDRKRLLVVELKKGRASDVVVGQILRYMSYVQDELAEMGQEVKGIVIALDDDQRIRRALSMVPTIEFYKYKVSFKLLKE